LQWWKFFENCGKNRTLEVTFFHRHFVRTYIFIMAEPVAQQLANLQLEVDTTGKATDNYERLIVNVSHSKMEWQHQIQLPSQIFKHDSKYS
jgi:hypothetical protein